MKRVIIINGPNLNLVGKREPEIYGNITFEEYLVKLKADFPSADIEYFQSNIEGEIINKIQEKGFDYDYIILNAGGYTHTSVAIGDAVASIKTPVIEVHISNIFSREEFRHQSFISKWSRGVITGFGLHSYHLALEYISINN